MDIKTVQGRVKHEGLSFLTITLPNFGKDFERSLDRGYVDRSLFTGFQWKGGLPRFLGGFLDRVFDRGGGVLLNDPDVDAILAIRQLTLMFGKILVPCSDARESKAMSDFVKCDMEVRQFDKKYRSDEVLQSDFRRISNMLFTGLFQDLDRKVFDLDLIPAHGPGSTADKLLGNQKYSLPTWTERLEAILPYGELALTSWSYYDQLESVHFQEPGAEQPVRVVSVPKTLKTPRIIAIEPTHMQYVQQALRAEFYEGVESGTFPWLRDFLGFTDQTPNQRMAREGSLNGNLATLDMSEASDRVSNQLVRDMLLDFPHLHGAVDACRSRKADVQGHGVIRLAKYASMGSALTFPVEAAVFLTCIFHGIEQQLNTPLTPKLINWFRGQVRVYGDDIIVPVNVVDSVVTSLQTFGAVVNVRKSFWNGKFRESCGKEYYDGHDVSIVKVRRVFPTHRRDAQEVISLISLRNQLYWAGYWETCAWLDQLIRKVIKYYPVVAVSSPVQGRHSVLGYQVENIDRNTHTPVVRGYVVSGRPPRNNIDGHGALLKYFLRASRTSVGDQNLRHLTPAVLDEDHLERSGRPQRVDIKLGWYQPY